MENSGLVSVIIPVFNVLSYLEEALDSVVNQTYRNLEIIIVDDGSTDGSGEICDEYGKRDARVKVIHQKNRCLSVARNVGLDIMTGDVVAFIDPDDKYLPNFICSMVSIMYQCEADIEVCKNSIQRTTGEMNERGIEQPSIHLSEGLYDRTSSLQARAEGLLSPNVWNKIYRSRLWNNARFPVGRVYEDIAIIHQILYHSERVFILNEVLYIRRIRPESITGTRSLQNQSDYVWALLQFEHFIENNPKLFSQEHLNRVRMQRLRQLVSCYVLSKKDSIDQNDIADYREQIVVLGRVVEDITFKVKVAYYIIRYCPWLIRTAYTLYQKIMGIQRLAIYMSRGRSC